MENHPSSPPSGNRFFIRWGYLAARWPWVFIVIWFCIIVAAIPGAKRAPNLFYAGSGDIANSASLRVDNLLRSEFENPYGQLLVLAIQDSNARDKRVTPPLPAATRPSFTLAKSPGNEAGIEAGIETGKENDSEPDWMGRLDKTLSALPQVAAVMTPERTLDARLLPPAGRGWLVLIGLRAGTLRDAEQAIPVIRRAVNSVMDSTHSRQAGLHWAVTGRSALTYDLNRFNSEDVTRAETRVIPLTLLILLFAFGSLIAAGAPLLLGIVTTTLTLSAMALLARHWELSNLVQNVSSMLGLAMGIDYSLFMIHRYRESLNKRIDTSLKQTLSVDVRREALAETLGTAGPAVFFSGITVMIGLAGLLFTPLMETRSIAWGGCTVALVSVFAALTLLPSLLFVLGPILEWPKTLSRRLNNSGQLGSPRWEAWSMVIMRWAPVALPAGLAVCLILSSPAAYTRFGFPEGPFIPSELEFSKGLALLSDMGQQGLVRPINIVLKTKNQDPVLTRERIPALYEFSQRILRDTSVARIFGPLDLSDHWPLPKYMDLYADTALAYERLPALKDFFLSRDGRSLLMQIMLKPQVGLESEKALARAIPNWMSVAGLDISVGGRGVYYNDFDSAMKTSYRPTLVFVLIVTGLALLLFFRSPVMAIKAMVLNSLSVAAGYGAVVFVFQLGHGSGIFGTPGPTEVVPLVLPLMLFCLLFGLSMDYEVFLISRIREVFFRNGDNTQAVARGIAVTGPIITQAALIMTSVFGAFAFAREIVVQMLGLGLAVAVMVDATLIRMVLVPAFMKLAGRWNWWPASLPSRRSGD